MMTVSIQRSLAALTLLAAATGAEAAGLDINLSDQALRAVFAGNLTDVFPRVGGVYEFGVLTGEEESRNYVQGHAGMLVTGDAGATQANVNAGLGGRIVGLGGDDFNLGDLGGGALALGGMFEARLPTFNRIGAVLYAYGAPKASSFGDLEGYLEYSAGLDYQVLQSASLYAGYRQLKVDVKDQGNRTLDNGWHLGLRLTF
jgi:hypothetical protein